MHRPPAPRICLTAFAARFSSRLRNRLRAPLWALTALLFSASAGMASCGQEIIDFDGLYLVISADKTPERIARLDFDLINDKGAKRVASGDNKFKVQLTESADVAVTPYRVQIKANAQWVGEVQLRVSGADGSGKIVATYNGSIDSTAKKEQLVHLVAIGAKPTCDADGDGVPKCTPECQTKGAACDCNDEATPDPDHGNVPKGKLASPFLTEDPCLDAGDGIDQDCDGTDLAKIDSDGDTDPDCFEQQKCPTVGGVAPEENPEVSTKAAELCDDVDNNCNGKVDDGMEFVDIDGQKKPLAKGDGCGAGVCKGGKVQCSADKKGLVCSTAANKKDEVCANKEDDDCDGQADEGCEADDLDGDASSNATEAACKFKYAKFHSEYHPGAAEPCCPTGQDCSGKDGLWDFNCDGKVTACPSDDPDGDGKSGDLDCEPNNPDIYSGAKQKCGDGKGPCPIDGDVPCSTDKDGDKYNAGDDCDDGSIDIHPGATELCNGIDDDCDGLVDEGNPGGQDEACGDKDGDCGLQPGVSVCKHFVPKDASFKPDDLDCLKVPYKAMPDGKTGVCIGCFGDNRPAKESCDTKDNDCDAQTDEDFPYEEEGSKKLLKWGETCDGIGTCGSGVVQCINVTKVICSTDPGGKKDQAKAEGCNNQDDNCNGKTDENLTLVSDSKCEKAGVCGAGLTQIQTICVSGIWRCDYSKVLSTEYDKNKTCKAGDNSCQCEGLDPGKPAVCYAMGETSCDSLDNDCNGQTDEDFDFKDFNSQVLKIGSGCGTGACAGGKVVCDGGKNANGLLTCDTLPKVTKEKCNATDDDCDGQTDEIAEMPVTDSTCFLVGVCNKDSVKATCPAGGWVCDYSKTAYYESGKEVSCDGLDNDCDGQTDEDFDFKEFDTKNLKIGAACGTGVCFGGKVVCTSDKKGLSCGTLVNVGKELCDYKDNDCDGQTDEDSSYTQEGGKVLPVLAACDGVGQCGAGNVECNKPDLTTCSSNANGSKHADITEKCNDLDDDCDGQTDEGCDLDKDQFCTSSMATDNKPKSCPKGGGDCDDDPAKNKDAGLVNPSVSEMCDSIDNNCSGQTDEIFKYTEPTGATAGVGANCGLGECSKAQSKVVCAASKVAAECPGFKPAEEICDNKDNDCDGQTDEGCDDDADKYCDVGMKVAGTPTVCPSTKIAKDGDPGDDCNDDPLKNGKPINPGAIEDCDDMDNNCSGKKDETCDDDNDLYCDAKLKLVGTPGVCPKGGNDCNDDLAAINPNGVEACDDVDNNCTGKSDEGCDDDGDQYCDTGMTVIGEPLVCKKTAAIGGKGDDCNDSAKEISPAATEICDDIDNNCAAGKDENCDNDNDLYCDAKIAMVGTPAVCPKGGNDCNDTVKDINPGATELCDDVDNNCKTGLDEGCDDDGDKFCDASMTVVGTPAVCTKGKDDCNDDPAKGGAAINTAAEEKCDDLDNNCKTGTDEGCDDDNDDYCDAGMKMGAVAPKTCLANVVKAPDTPGDDCNDDPSTGLFVNPGKKEVCDGKVDENCNGKTDEESAINCTDLFFDNDKDGYGAGTKKCLCKVSDVSGYTATVGSDCDDTNNLVFPNQTETCATSYDDNCNSSNNDENAATCKVFYLDSDGDSFGVDTKKCLCSADSTTKYTADKAGDCNDDPTKAGNTQNPSKTELCNDKDDDCKTGVDEGCDDDNDDYCDSTMTVVSVTATCPKTNGGSGSTGNDCQDDPAKSGLLINPSKTEICNDADDNCNGSSDEGCDDDNDDYCDSAMTVVGVPATCKQSNGGVGALGTDCNDDPAKSGSAQNPGKTEVCNNIDDDCKAGVDDGCDDDNDDFCDDKMTVFGKPATCTQTDGGAGGKLGNDCNDAASNGLAQNPAKPEICNDIDDNCSGAADEGCDDDNDDYCDKNMTVVNTPLTCSKTTASATGSPGNDCEDDLTKGGQFSNPGKTELCNDIDDNCSGVSDEGCDDDNDDYCDANMTIVNTPKTCTKTVTNNQGTPGNDCEDDPAKGGSSQNPGKTEICNSKDDNCSGATDEGVKPTVTDCPKIGKGVCTQAEVDKSAVCTAGTWSCNYVLLPDYASAAAPNQEAPLCSDTKDNDCDGTTDNCL